MTNISYFSSIFIRGLHYLRTLFLPTIFESLSSSQAHHKLKLQGTLWGILSIVWSRTFSQRYIYIFDFHSYYLYKWEEDADYQLEIEIPLLPVCFTTEVLGFSVTIKTWRLRSLFRFIKRQRQYPQPVRIFMLYIVVRLGTILIYIVTRSISRNEFWIRCGRYYCHF